MRSNSNRFVFACDSLYNPFISGDFYTTFWTQFLPTNSFSRINFRIFGNSLLLWNTTTSSFLNLTQISSSIEAESQHWLQRFTWRRSSNSLMLDLRIPELVPKQEDLVKKWTKFCVQNFQNSDIPKFSAIYVLFSFSYRRHCRSTL